MLVDEDKITDLIPQRHPMVMVQSLEACDDKITVSGFEIRKDNIFIEEGRLSASGILENMAQTAAARTGLLFKAQPGGTNKKVPVGVIGSIKSFHIYFRPLTGSVLITTITVEHEVMQATVVKARTQVEGRLAAECEMQIFLTGNQD